MSLLAPEWLAYTGLTARLGGQWQQRRTHGGDHNAERALQRCPECNTWEASITTATSVDHNEELVVGNDECVMGGRDAEWPMEKVI